MKMRYKKHYISYQSNNNKLKCTCCGHYYDIWATPDQALNCASHLWYDNNTWYIYGSYPSAFDDTRFIIHQDEFIQERHKIAFTQREDSKYEYGHYNTAKLVVCDTCIHAFLFNQWIVQDSAYNPYAAIEELNSFYQEDPYLYMEIMKAGPSKCITLIREERAKPIEQRLREKSQRILNNARYNKNTLY